MVSMLTLSIPGSPIANFGFLGMEAKKSTTDPAFKI